MIVVDTGCATLSWIWMCFCFFSITLRFVLLCDDPLDCCDDLGFVTLVEFAEFTEFTTSYWGGLF